MIPVRFVATAAGAVLAAGTLFAIAPRMGVAQAGNPRASTVQKVFPSALRLQITAGGEVVRSASAVAFARRGASTYLLTNAHVVEPSARWKGDVAVHVLTPGANQHLTGFVVACGKAPDLDLAVIELRGADIPVTALAPDDALELGDDLVVIGAPFGKGLSVAAGIVSQVEFSEDAAAPRAPKALKTDAAVGYGSSGGGVFDVPGGRLVGLVEGYRTARLELGKDQGYAVDLPMPGETFVAPAAKIRRFLTARGLGELAAGAATAALAPAVGLAPAACRM